MLASGRLLLLVALLATSVPACADVATIGAPVAVAQSQPIDTVEPPEIDLEATLEEQDAPPNGKGVILTFTLTNRSHGSLYVLKWYTPLEGIAGEIFRVERDGEAIPYEGILASRTAPTSDSYIFLEANESVSAEVDLATAYDFTEAGQYTIEFISPRISHVARTPAEMADTMDDLGPVPMPSNAVTIKIAGSSDEERLQTDSDKSPPQAPAESPSVPRTITVIGEGKVSLEPDIAMINVGAEARAGTVSEAKAEADAQMAAIVKALGDVGIADRDIQTSHYGIHYEREPMPAMPTPRDGPAEFREGYVVSNIVRVTVRNVEKAGEVLDSVIQAGANQVHGVSFTVADEGAWQSQARSKAMADARSRADELAGLAGLELGEVLTVSEVIGGIPAPMMGIKSGMGGGGMAPGELELSTQIQVMFAAQ